MAAQETKRVAESITLDRLIEVSSISAIKTFEDMEIERFNPRIWVGIWIEPFGPREMDFSALKKGS